MKSYWIKERHNPQFDKPYYAACGQLSYAKARRMQAGTLYGHNVMLEFASLDEYNREIERLKASGFTVHVRQPGRRMER